MLKILFVLLFTCTLYASEQVEIYATKMQTENSVVSAIGEATVVYKDYYISANKAVYNKETGDLELFDKVRANQQNKYTMLGDYVRLNLKNKNKIFKPFYMLEESSQIWINAQNAESTENKIKIKSGIVSSCEPINPMWKMEFSSSDYDLNTEWLNLYNTKFYLYDIPVFYTPWFGYSLNKDRRSGLLLPSMGLSKDDGFYYEQPIYIAEYNDWDLEFKPQIRTRRGAGIYSTFRFADSQSSKGSFKVGHFQDKNKYFLENNLDSDTHSGFDFDYENSDFMNKLFGINVEGQSGLYIDIGYMNDVDYINLESSNTIPTAVSTQVLSRINIFNNRENHYIGAYFENYQDLTLATHDNVLQQLPTIHYHKYLDALMDNHLAYSIDVQSTNIHRQLNTKVIQTDVNVPLTIHTALFDEYLDLTMQVNNYLQNSSFHGDETRNNLNAAYDNGTIVQNSNILNVSSNLVKQYDDFSHSISFGTSYLFDVNEDMTGFYKSYKDFCSNETNKNQEVCEFFNLTESSQRVQLEFSQYVFNNLGEETLYHRMSQHIQKNKEFGDLENEINYIASKNITLYNNTFYNHKKGKLTKVYNKIDYQYSGFNISGSHLYQDDIDNTSNFQSVSYLTTQATYEFNNRYVYSFIYDYDIESKIDKRTEVGFLYKKRCWEFGIRYSQNKRPELGRNGIISNENDKYIYFTIALKPFIQSGNNGFISYELSSDKNE